MAYHRFTADDGSAYGSFQVFHHDGGNTHADAGTFLDCDGNLLPAGWYWWACFPGCLPDGEPCGPFKTEAAAIRNAREEG